MLATKLPPLMCAFYVVDRTSCKIFHVGFCVNTKSIGETISILRVKTRLIQMR